MTLGTSSFIFSAASRLSSADAAQIGFLYELENGLRQRRGVQRYLGFGVLVPDSQNHRPCRHLVKVFPQFRQRTPRYRRTECRAAGLLDRC